MAMSQSHLISESCRVFRMTGTVRGRGGAGQNEKAL